MKNMENNIVNHEDAQEAKEAALEAFKEAYDSGKWMTVVFGVRNGKIRVSKTSFQFPSADLQKSVQMIRNLIARELPPIRSPFAGSPLPVSPEFANAGDCPTRDPSTVLHMGSPSTEGDGGRVECGGDQ